MATVKANTAEGGSSGTTVTTGNSGGGSGDAFASVTLVAGGTAQFSNTHAHGGTLSYKLANTAAAENVRLNYSGLTQIATYYARCYIYLTANPVGNNPIMVFWSAIDNTEYYVNINSSGHLQIQDGSAVATHTTTATITLNAWVRVEAMCTGSATVGQRELKLFNSPESTTPTETLTSAATLNTSGNLKEVDFGAMIAGDPSIGPLWFDDLAVANTAYPGPVATSFISAGTHVVSQAVTRSNYY